MIVPIPSVQRYNQSPDRSYGKYASEKRMEINRVDVTMKQRSNDLKETPRSYFGKL